MAPPTTSARPRSDAVVLATHTRPDRALVDYLEGLTLHGGDHDGARMVALPWQRRFLRHAFRGPGDAAVSVARGSGKSALVAGVACAVVDPRGPLNGARREVVCVAASFEQSRVIFEDVLAFIGDLYDLENREQWRKQDSANRAWLEHRATGARVRCIGSDPATAHGLRSYLVLADEPAQWEHAKRDRMLAALKTGLGKTPGSRLIALGTRPADASHWFAKMLTGAGVGYAQVHAARDQDPPFAVKTWRRANPSMDHLPSLRAKIAEDAEDARHSPELLASFRALRLNMGVEDTDVAVLLDAGLWESIEGAAAARGPVVWGVDMGTNAAQSAVAAFWPETGALQALAAFPCEPDLQARGIRDGCGLLYRHCADRGQLLQLGHRTVDVAALLRAALDRFGKPARVASDRWREGELRDALEAAGIPTAAFESRGQGFMDGGEDVRTFRRACAEGRVTPAPSLLMRSAMAEARTVSDAAGNAKLSKGSQGGRRQRARDDAAAAAILAVSAGVRLPVAPTRRWRYRGAA